MKIADVAGAGPALTLETVLHGETAVWGMFQDRFGVPRQTFRAHISGQWEETTQRLTLTEDFTVLGGETTRRVWTLTKRGDGVYQGDANDLVNGVDVWTGGAAARMRYRMRVPIGGRAWALSFDDWLFRIDERVILNRATVTKVGITLGTVTSVFEPA